jgi:VWFA-related protein
MRIKALAASMLALSIGLGTAAAQDTDDQIELSAQEVLLDIVVTDSKGRPVTDLRRDEVEVLEGGDPQEITSFSLIESSGSTATAAPGGKAPVSIELSPFRGFNFIIVVVDRTSLDQRDLKSTLEAGNKFLNERLQPNDLVSVFVASNRLIKIQDFTNNKEKLLRALQIATGGGGQRIELSQEDITASQVEIFSSDPSAQQANQPGGAQTAPVAGDVSGAIRDLQTISNDVATTFDTLREQFQAVALVQSLLSLMKTYSRVPGRKSVVLFSEGFAVESAVEGSFASLIGSANRNNFAFYTVDAAGLRPTTQSRLGPSSGVPGTSTIIGNRNDPTLADPLGNTALGRAERDVRSGGNGALHRLAVDTGGVPLRNNNDLNRGFQAVEADLRSYYAVSYAPRNANFDGKFRPVTIKVSRKGVDVRTRKGYYATPGGGVLLPFEQPVLELLAASKPGERPSALPVMVRLDRFRSGTGWALPIYTHLAASALVPSERKDDKGNVAYDFEVDMVAIVRDTKGTIVAKASRSFLYASQKTALEAFRQLELTNSFSQPMVLAPGTYKVQLAVYDPNAQKGTVVERAILLPPVPAGGPMLSSIVLSRDVVPVPEKERAAAASDPLVFEGTTRIVPNATGRFVKSRGDQIVTFFRFYGAPSKQYQVRIEFIRDGQVVSASQPANLPLTDANGETSFAPTLPIASLEPGAYIVRIAILEPGAPKPVADATGNFRVDP